MNVTKELKQFFLTSSVLRTSPENEKQLFTLYDMCGSLLSKFRRSGNQVAPVDETAFTQPKRVRCKTRLAEESTSICQFGPVNKSSSNDLEKKDKSDAASVGNLKDESATESLANREAGRLQELSPRNEKDAEARAMDSAVAILSAQGSMDSSDRKMRAMQSAREILEAQMESGPSSSTTVASQLVSSTRSVLMGETSNAIAFEVLVGHRPTVRPSARVPRRLRKLESQPRASTKQVNAKLLAAEERKLRELENIRARASSRAAGRPHPAEAASKATAQKIASKQAAAERNRNEVIAKKKQSGSKSSKKRNKIAAAQASAKAELQSAIGQKMEKAVQRKAERKQQRENQKNLREERTRKVRENIEHMLREEEKEVLEDLQELEADQAYCASDSDESWGGKDDTVVYEWEDFFAD